MRQRRSKTSKIARLTRCWVAKNKARRLRHSGRKSDNVLEPSHLAGSDLTPPAPRTYGERLGGPVPQRVAATLRPSGKIAPSSASTDTMGQSAARCGTIGALENIRQEIAPCVKRTT